LNSTSGAKSLRSAGGHDRTTAAKQREPSEARHQEQNAAEEATPADAAQKTSDSKEPTTMTPANPRPLVSAFRYVDKRLHVAVIAMACFFLGIAPLASPAAGQADRRYQAQWIWCGDPATKPFQFVRFHKTLDLGKRPENATAYIAADTFYRLWINGQLVMHGPARSSRGKVTVDPVPVGEYLVQGKNTLMVEVFHGVCPFEALAQSPGFLCELEAESGGERKILAATDATWNASTIAAWSRDSLRFSYQRGWIEQYDGRRIPEEKPTPAVVLGKVGMKPWEKVAMRDIPLPAPLLPVRPTDVVAVQRSDGFVGDIEPVGRFELPRPEWDKQSVWFRRLQTERLRDESAAAVNPSGVTTRGHGDAILEGDGASVSYDLGLGYVGFLDFEVSGRAGEVVEVVWNEQLSGDGAVRPRAQTGNNAVSYTLCDGRQSLVTFMPQFARYLRIAHRGPGRLKLHRLGMTEYRFDAKPLGDFRCSDEQINRIYDAARRTAMLCTLDAYMDCPHRERNAMYSLEAYWMEMAVYPMFGDTSVSRRSVLYGADSVEDPDRTGPPGLVQVAYPMHLKFFNCVIPTGPLFWVLHTGLYERCSGDKELIRAMLPVIRRNLAAFDRFRNREGLLESIPSWMFFDYADIRTDGVSVALNALYARTLDEASRLARLVGDAAYADECTKLAVQARASLNRCCAGETFYPDVLLRNAKQELTPSREACETTQYYVMWSNVPPQDRMRRMWRALRDDFLPTPLKRVQPILGLNRAGLYPFPQRLQAAAALGDYAAVLRDTKAMFLPMIDRAPGTLWEDPMAQIALAHSVGCGIGGILTEETLGIRFGFPLRITPHSGGSLAWCKGHITTPKGRVEVAWTSRKDRYELRAVLPANTPAEIVLPEEAKAVWASAQPKTPWPATVTIPGSATLIVEPGSVVVK
jgi:alpha-L-rhamnosidase